MKVHSCVLLLLLALLSANAHAASYVINSTYAINTNKAIYSIGKGFNSNEDTLYFNTNVSNNTVLCGSSTIGSKLSVAFGNNTYNNSITNCTITGMILSHHNARNNLIAVNGSYALSFTDNSSNVGIGNYLHVVVRNATGNLSVADFIEVLPLRLLHLGVYDISEAWANRTVNESRLHMPRFGMVYVNSTNSNMSGEAYFAAEGKEISKNGSYDFGRYVFYAPFAIYDMQIYTIFNATRGGTYAPTAIQPIRRFDEILPTNKPVFYNFTFAFYNKSSSKATLFNGWQYEKNNTVLGTFYNLSNGTFSYYAGFPSLGIHEYILQLITPYDNENTTTLVYSYGLSYCTPDGAVVQNPGYYPFASNSLQNLRVFWFTNKTCVVGANILTNNAVIDCRGGMVNASTVDFSILWSNNITVENCRLYGNGVQVIGSNSIWLYNDTFIATNKSSLAINITGSNVNMSYDMLQGFRSALRSNSSAVSEVNVTYGPLMQENAGIAKKSLFEQLQPVLLALFFAAFAITLGVLIRNRQRR